MLDLGAETSDIVITEGGELRLTRNVNIGDDYLMQAVASKLDVEFQSAEKLKEEQAIVLLEGEPLPEDRTVQTVHEVTLPILNDLVMEMRRSLDDFQPRWWENRVGHVVISGGAARWGLDRFLYLGLDVETVLGDPFVPCDVVEWVLPADLPRQVVPAPATAVGLAVWGAAER